MVPPTVQSVHNWKEHFQPMAKGKISPEDIYIPNQCSSGLGNNRMGKADYIIQNGAQQHPQLFSSSVAFEHSQKLNQKSKLKKGQTERER